MVRIWCMPVDMLDRQHLLGEHGELHCIFNVILKEKVGLKAGFQNHPETKRFKNHLGMLLDRHRQQMGEFKKRGYKHNKPLIKNPFIHDYYKLLPIPYEEYVYSRSEHVRDLKVLVERKGVKEK